jgi:DNA polymerase III sliding clamp (beta) subunit (PCNA family)
MMRFRAKVNVKEMREATKVFEKSNSRKAEDSILTLEAKEEGIRVTAVNNCNRTLSSCIVPGYGEGIVGVNATMLKAAMNGIASNNAKLSLDYGECTLTVSDSDTKITLDSFPENEAAAQNRGYMHKSITKIPTATLFAVLKRAKTFASKDSNMRNLHSVLFESVNEALSIISCNRYSMIKKDLDVRFVDRFILDLNNINELLSMEKLFKDESIGVSYDEKEERATFTDGKTVFQSITSDENFPDWTKVYPKDYTIIQAISNPKEFIESVKAAKSFIETLGTNKPVIMRFNGEFSLTATDRFKKVVTDVSPLYKSVDSLDFGINPTFLLNALNNTKDVFELTLKDSNSVMKVSKTDEDILIMPIRLV